MIGAHSLLAALLAALTGGGSPPGGDVVRPVLTPLPPKSGVPAPVRTPLPTREDAGARLTAPAALRDAPGGAVVARIGTRTEFGSPRVLPVIHREGDWLGVLATERPNGEVGWIRASQVRLVSEPVRLGVDLSQRTLSVIEGGRTVRRFAVGIGARSTPTPTGWFAVTDSLHGWGPYGCCILALSGHQPRLSQGWTGGDRLAVHGTPAPATIGAATSLGCLRAADGNMRALLRVARLGARVHITS